MNVEKSTNSEIISELNKIENKILSKGKGTKSIIDKIEYSLEVFSNQVQKEIIKIECSYAELCSLVNDYLNMLSKQQSLSVLFTIGIGCQIEAYKRVELLRHQCDISFVMPDDSNVSRIRLFVAFIKPYESEMFLIDYCTRFFY